MHKQPFVVDEWVRRWIRNDTLNSILNCKSNTGSLHLLIDTAGFEHVGAMCSYCLHHTPSIRPYDRSTKAIMFDMLHVIAYWHELMLFCPHQWNAGVNGRQSILFSPCTMYKIWVQKCLIMNSGQKKLKNIEQNTKSVRNVTGLRTKDSPVVCIIINCM